MSIAGSIKESYTASEWSAKEDYYMKELDKLVIPTDAKTADIKMIMASIDRVNSEASMELAYCSKKVEVLDRMRKIIEKELFITVKSMGIQGVKTEADVNGAVAILMRDIPASDVMAGNPPKINTANLMAILSQQPGQVAMPSPVTQKVVNINDALNVSESRMIFMEHVVDVLKTKASALITIEGALKLEVGVGNNNNP